MNTIFWTTIFLLVSVSTSGKWENKPRDESLALTYKEAAIASILTAGLAGICLPAARNWVPTLSPESNFFFLVKTFAGGVFLATGFIHILSDAFDSLTSPCISESQWRDFPFTGFIAMVAAIGTLMVNTYATSYYRRRSGVNSEGADGIANEENEDSGHAHGGHGHVHGAVRESEESGLHGTVTESEESELDRAGDDRIGGEWTATPPCGLSGTSENSVTIKPLIDALAFYQFFEGLGLGGCITQARYNTRTIVIMVLFFALTSPGGIAIGIGITHIYRETSPTAIMVQGILNYASAGILIYMALVDLGADFMSARLQGNGKLQMGANFSMLLATGLMALVAKWA